MIEIVFRRDPATPEIEEIGCLVNGGLKIEESVLLPPGWVHATQDDGLNTYTGPLSKMPVNPKFSKLKLPRDLYAALLRL
jgi:hypothetical protein